MLHKELHFIKEHIAYLDKENLQVSKVSVGWHLDHSLKVLNGVSTALKNSNTNDYQKKFNPFRLLVFTLGAFPRGKAKAPKRVLPPEIILKEDIENQLKLVVKNLEAIQNLDKHSNFKHHVFKQLNKKQTIRFLKIHTNHHLKIAKEILK